MPAENMTEVICHACMLNLDAKIAFESPYLTFIWLLHNSWLWTSVTSKKKDIGTKHFFHTSMTFGQSMMVTIIVLKSEVYITQHENQRDPLLW